MYIKLCILKIEHLFRCGVTFNENYFLGHRKTIIKSQRCKNNTNIL